MKRSEFSHQSVTSLLEAMYLSLNRETMERLLESCGRASARTGAVEVGIASTIRGGSDRCRFTVQV